MLFGFLEYYSKPYNTLLYNRNCDCKMFIYAINMAVGSQYVQYVYEIETFMISFKHLNLVLTLSKLCFIFIFLLFVFYDIFLSCNICHTSLRLIRDEAFYLNAFFFNIEIGIC